MSDDAPREQSDGDGNGNKDSAGGVSTRSIVRSILSAAFGVQSSRNQQRDFAQGNYRHFIIGGIVFTVLFVLTLVLVVNLVLGGR